MRIAAESLEVLRPRKLREALTMLRDEGPLLPLAGGTDIFVALNAGLLRERRFIDLWGLDELRGIHRRGRGRSAVIEIGALATYSECRQARPLRKHLPILVEAAGQVGGVQVQNRGTLGGNVGNGSPAGDSLPVLAVADTTVVLGSLDGEREVPFDAYYTGYRATVRRPDELILRFEIRVPEGEQRFRKVGTRAAQAISKVAMAAIGHRVAFGSVAPTVVRARRVEAYLDAGGDDPAEARRLLAEDVHPIDDVRSTGEYRLRVAGNLLVDLMGKA